MEPKLTRRGLLAHAAMLPIIARSAAVGPVAAFLSPRLANAQEPVTIVMAAAAVVGAISSFMSSGGDGGLDPASQAYFERILANQEKISSQINEINAQLKTLAGQISILAPQTVTLDRRVQAKGVFHAVTTMEIQILDANLRGNPIYGPSDRRSFDDLLERLRGSASDHVALAQEVAQSIDVIIAIDALRLAMESLVNIAIIAGYTAEDDKRSLKTTLSLIGQAARDIDTGKFQPTLGGFRQALAENRTELLNTSAAAAEFSEDREYKIPASVEFYRQVEPTELHGALTVAWREDYAFESCGGKYIENSAHALSKPFPAIWRPLIDRGFVTPAECKPGLKHIVSPYWTPMSVAKATLRTPDYDPSYFIITLDPLVKGSRYVTLIEAFNRAKVRAQVLHSADLVLGRTLAAIERIDRTIEEA